MTSAGPLTPEELRRQKSLFRVYIYANGIVLILLFILFPKHIPLTSAVWFIETFAVIYWMIVKVRRQARSLSVDATPEEKLQSRKGTSRRMKRISLLELVCAIVLAVVGPHKTPILGYAGFLVLLAGAAYLFARKLSR